MDTADVCRGLRGGEVVKLRRRWLLETTKVEEKDIAAAAIKGLSSPMAAMGKAATL